MISVKFTKDAGGLIGPCAGLHKITAVYAATAGRWCDGVRTLIVDVYVDSSYSTIEAAASAGSAIYSESDCTLCANFGWYGDPGGNKCWSFQSFEGDCIWGVIPENCDTVGAISITVRGSTSVENACAGVGTLYYNVYVDDNFPNATGMWADAALTTTATDSFGNTLPARYYKEEGGLNVVRYWSPSQSLETRDGGYFSGNDTLCTSDPSPTRYRLFLRYDQFNFDTCNGTSVTVWADNQNFELATTLYTTETGTTKRQDGYYVIDSSRAVISPGDTNVFEVRRLLSGTLVDTSSTCETGPGDRFE
jgi:hypothetical protein